MSGASRQSRQSESTFGEVLAGMRSLTIEVWLPRTDDAEESVTFIKRKLDQMVAEMKAESFTNPPQYVPPRGLVETPFNLKSEPR